MAETNMPSMATSDQITNLSSFVEITATAASNNVTIGDNTTFCYNGCMIMGYLDITVGSSADIATGTRLADIDLSANVVSIYTATATNSTDGMVDNKFFKIQKYEPTGKLCVTNGSKLIKGKRYMCGPIIAGFVQS